MEDERVLGCDVEGAVREGGGDLGAGLEGGDVARADALADLAEDGAVADERDGEVEDGGVFAVGLAQHAARGDGELAAAEAREEGQGVPEVESDGGEVVEDLEDGAARAGGVVEILVCEGWV